VITAQQRQRSHVLEVRRDTIPEDLRKRRQWVNCQHGEKIPLNPRTGRYASTTDSLTWGAFEEAVRRAEEHGLGIGFVFSSGDPFVGVDLDKCRSPETGEIAPWAQEIIEEVDSYTEVSPSGTGVHIIAKGKLPKSLSKKLTEVDGKIECTRRSDSLLSLARWWRWRCEDRNKGSSREGSANIRSLSQCAGSGSELKCGCTLELVDE
jgi:hypothetical protein